MNGRWSAICRRKAKRWAMRRFWMWRPAGWMNCRSWKSGCTSWKRRARCHTAEYMEAHAKHDALNDPEVETKAKKMLRGLGYRETDFDRKAKEMSGGWIMRARLARLLVMEPDLAPARRTDQPSRFALAALAAELPEELFRRAAADFARPPVHGRGRGAGS